MTYGTKKTLLSAAAICMAITISGMAAAQEQPASSNDSSHKIEVVRITSLLGMKPETVTVKKGTTVVWVNQLSGGVEILFTAKQVTRACLSPTNFSITKEGSFKSAMIPPKGVASLCFIENGKYDYVVSTQAVRDSSPAERVKPLVGGIVVE
jgi:plastocyanin